MEPPQPSGSLCSFAGALTSAQCSGQETLDKLVNQYTPEDSLIVMIPPEGSRGDAADTRHKLDSLSTVTADLDVDLSGVNLPSGADGGDVMLVNG